MTSRDAEVQLQLHGLRCPFGGKQVIHLSNSLWTRKQSSIDGFRALKSPYINNEIDQRVEVGDGAAIAHPRSFDASCFGLAVNAFATCTLGVDCLVEWARAVQQHAHLPALLPVDILDAALAFRELEVATPMAVGSRKEQGAAEALGAIAIRVGKRVGGVHAQACRTQRHPIRSAARASRMGIEWDRCDPTVASSRFVDVPGIEGRIGSQVSREAL